MEGLVVVIVPARNEAGAIASVVRGLLELPPPLEVVVVDDASEDDTGAVASAAGATVLRLAVNLGIGGAVQTGFQYAMGRGAEFAVQVDGDGQHPASAVPELLAPLRKGGADMVIGSRFLQKGGFRSTVLRRIGIALLARAVRLTTGRQIRDPTSGFRAVNRRVMERFAEDYPEDYPEPESLVNLLSHLRASILEVPVQMEPRRQGVSSIRGITSAYYMVKVLLAVLLTRLRKGAVR